MQGQVRLGNTVGENPDIEANLDVQTLSSYHEISKFQSSKFMLKTEVKNFRNLKAP